MPPDQRPESADVTWIPGYTAWDDERNDYVWVSGVWRAPPARSSMDVRVLGKDALSYFDTLLPGYLPSSVGGCSCDTR
ncbi:MAG: hypothetical protein ABIG44_13675 [Planctomycetota bacterium]